MAREGGYGKSTKAEWIKTDRLHYGEALRSSGEMKQDLETWLVDAIAHHVYRCEMIMGREKHAQASREAAAAMKPSPLESDYMPTRKPPTITRNAANGGPSGGRVYGR